MDSRLRGNDGGGRSTLRQAQGERGWIPAYAGMTVMQGYPQGRGEEDGVCSREKVDSRFRGNDGRVGGNDGGGVWGISCALQL